MPRFFILLLSIASLHCFAADPEYNFYRDKGAIRGYDPVAYFSLLPGDRAVEGKEEFTHIWKNTKWRFANASNRDKFIQNPEAYAPQYGGYCAFAVGKNFTTSIRPNSWVIHEGKLYLNHNRYSRRLFNEDINESIEKANENWPKVLQRCERRGNCRKQPKRRHIP